MITKIQRKIIIFIMGALPFYFLGLLIYISSFDEIIIFLTKSTDDGSVLLSGFISWIFMIYFISNGLLILAIGISEIIFMPVQLYCFSKYHPKQVKNQIEHFYNAEKPIFGLRIS